MDGIHDLGGLVGFGPVDNDGVDDAVFGAEWERRAMGITFVTFMRGLYNGGQFRHVIERMDPAHYVSSRYYEHWLTGSATRLVEERIIDRDELEARAGGPFPLSRPVHPAASDEALELAEATAAPPPRVGDVVCVIAGARVGHTRCPRYVRGKIGTVVRVDPEASLADLEAHTDRRRSDPVCCVRFEGRTLWGSAAENAAVHVDLWASYLEPAEGEHR